MEPQVSIKTICDYL